MIYYHIYRDTVARVVVLTARNSETSELEHVSPKASLKLLNHSPTGFEFGYGGIGPAQLALAILYHHTGNVSTSLAKYHHFKWERIATLDTRQGEHIISASSIDVWLRKELLV